jgi:hypothetical protein
MLKRKCGGLSAIFGSGVQSSGRGEALQLVVVTPDRPQCVKRGGHKILLEIFSLIFGSFPSLLFA